MGGGKETPRQKMVGLMYLVLMALLAMNVSKEIINAFVTLNNKLESQNSTLNEGNIEKLYKFDAQIAGLVAQKADEKEIEGVKYWKNIAFDVNSSAVTAVSGVMTLAKEMLDQGGPGEWVVTDERTGLMSIVDLNAENAEYPKKDDYDTPSRMFGPSNLGGENKGEDLLNIVNNFRDSLALMIGNIEKEGKTYTFEIPEITKANAEDTAYYETLEAALANVHPDAKGKIKEIYKILTFPEQVKNHGEDVPWAQGQFDHSPMVAASALLTSIKGQILQAEAVALDYLTNQTEVAMFKFDTIEATAYANTAYVNSGDSVKMSVRISAYDSKAPTVVRYWLDDTARTGDPVQTDMENIAFGGGVGKHTIVGDLQVEEKGVKKWKPWNFSYEVGAPSGAVGNYDMKILYKGYDNRIVASGSGFPDDQIVVSCSGCSLSQTNFDGKKGYIAKVSSGKKATVTVSGKTPDGKSTQLVSEDFRIMDMPDPTPILSGVNPAKGSIAKGQIRGGQMGAKLLGSPLQVKYQILSFVFEVQVGAKKKSIRAKGAALTPEMYNTIKGLKPGANIVIKQTTVRGPSGKRILPTIAYSLK